MERTARQSGATRWNLIRWELCWIPVEMIGVALGLLLGIGWDHWGAASFVFVGVLAVSFAVRFRHYGELSPPVRATES